MFSISNKLVIGFPGAQWVLRGDTYADLEWMDPDIPKPAEEELEAAFIEKSHDRAITLLRAKRNDLLAQTDKYMIPDFPITPEKRQEYLAYRQALRDLTTTAQPSLKEENMMVYLDESSVTWPETP